MLSRKVKTISAFLLTVLLLFPMQITHIVALTAQEKIGPELLEKMDQTPPDEKLPVYVWAYEPDLSHIDRQIGDILGEQWDYPGTDDEYFLEALALRRRLLSEYYTQFNTEFLNALGLEEKDLVIQKTDAPLVIVWLAKEQVYSISELDMVSALRLYDIRDPDTEDMIFEYDSVDALRILQASVGLIYWTHGPEFDINQDGQVNALDALLALQSSVGLITISWPEDTVFPE